MDVKKKGRALGPARTTLSQFCKLRMTCSITVSRTASYWGEFVRAWYSNFIGDARSHGQVCTSSFSKEKDRKEKKKEKDASASALYTWDASGSGGTASGSASITPAAHDFSPSPLRNSARGGCSCMIINPLPTRIDQLGSGIPHGLDRRLGRVSGAKTWSQLEHVVFKALGKEAASRRSLETADQPD